MRCLHLFHASTRSFALFMLLVGGGFARPAAAQEPPATVAPVKNPGVEVFHPVPTAELKPDQMAFVDGCAEYLAFVVCGQPEFGQTLDFRSTARGARELHLPRTLRLSLDDGAQVAKITGGTDIAVGEASLLSGNRLAVSYRLYDVASRHPIGTPITLSGSLSEIAAGLPHASALMCRQLGSVSPTIPKTIDLTVAELAAIGQISVAGNPPASAINVVRKASQKSALGAAVSLPFLDDSGDLQDAANRLAESLAPANTMTYVVLIQKAPAAVSDERMKARAAKYPNSAATAYAEMLSAKLSMNSGESQAALERLLKDAPMNPDAYASAASVLAESVDLAQSFEAAGAPPEGTKSAAGLRAARRIDEQRAVELDPTHETAWLQLAIAAADLGDRETVRSALDKALLYHADRYQLFVEGFRITGPKFGSTRAEMAKIAQAASQYPHFSDIEQVNAVLELLRAQRFYAECKSLGSLYRSQLEAKLKKTPRDATALQFFGRFLILSGSPVEGRAYVVKAIPLTEGNYYSLMDCAEAFYEGGYYSDARPIYAQLHEKKFNSPALYRHMCAILLAGRDYKKAIAYGRLSVQKEENKLYLGGKKEEEPEGYFLLGQSYFGDRQFDLAIPQFTTAAEDGVRTPRLYAMGAIATAEFGDSASAEKWAKDGLQFFGDEGAESAYPTSDYAYLHYAAAVAHRAATHFDEALSELDRASGLDPAYGPAFLLRGALLEAQGKRNDARAQWQNAATKCTEPADIAKAKKALSDHPAAS